MNPKIYTGSDVSLHYHRFFFYQVFWIFENNKGIRFFEKIQIVPGSVYQVNKNMYQVFYQVEKLYQGEKYQVLRFFIFQQGELLNFRLSAFALLSFPYIRLHDWICMYTTLFMYQDHFLCTRFYVPGFGLYQVFFSRFFVFFEMYQVSKYQVFQKSIRFKLPGQRKYQVKSTRPGTFLSNLVKKKPMPPLLATQFLDSPTKLLKKSQVHYQSEKNNKKRFFDVTTTESKPLCQ